MKHADTPTAVPGPDLALPPLATDWFVLELEERLECSSVAANLMKCQRGIPPGLE